MTTIPITFKQPSVTFIDAPTYGEIARMIGAGLTEMNGVVMGGALTPMQRELARKASDMQAHGLIRLVQFMEAHAQD